MLRFFSGRGRYMKRKILQHTVPPASAFLLTLGLFLLYFAIYGLYPFGGKSIVWCDMEQQAVPLLVQFRRMAERGESIAYTALDAGGMPFYGVFFFFLSNPLSLLVLVTKIPADMLVNLLVIIKLSLASATAVIWLRTRAPEGSAVQQVLLAMMYGCSGYGLFYYQNLMWLDIMLLLPLLMISLRTLIRDANAVPYFLVLSMMMVSCFYLCYMIVLFLLLYTALSVRFLVPQERQGLAARKLWGASFLAACVTAAVWLPCYLQVQASARSGSLLENLMRTYPVNHLDDKLALLCCTALCLAVLPALWRHEPVPSPLSTRDRALFLLLSSAMLLDPINAMWHTGSYQAFPFRWALIPILLLLTLAARELAEPVSVKKLRISGRVRAVLLPVFCIALAAAAAALLIKKAGDRILTFVKTLWMDEPTLFLLLIPIVFVTAGYILCLRRQRRGMLARPVCSVILAALFLCEFTLNFHCYIGKAGDEDKLFAQTVSAADRIDDPGFWRVRMTKKYAHANMIGALGYPTLSHYTSLTREDVMHGVKRMGYSSYWMEITGTGGTVLTDGLWNIRYLLGQKPDFPPDSETLWSDGILSIAKTAAEMPGAVLIDALPEEIAALPSGSRSEVQRVLAEQMLGLRGCVTDYPVTKTLACTLGAPETGGFVCKRNAPEGEAYISFDFFARGRQAIYFDLYSQTGTNIGNPRNGAVSVYRNGRRAVSEYPQSSANGLVFLGYAENEYMSVRADILHDFDCESFGVFGLALDPLEQAMADVSGAELEYRSGEYRTAVQTDAPKTLVLSVAYDEGFSAEINGEPAEVYRVNDCQCAVRVPAGESEVVLRFRVRGLKTALLISGFGLICTVFWLLFRQRITRTRMKKLEKLSAFSLQGVYWALILFVYVLPVVLSVIGLFYYHRLW